MRVLGLASLVVSLAAAVASTACVPAKGPRYVSSYRGGATPGAVTAGWVTVAPPSTGIRLHLPKQPTIETERGRMSDGGLMTQTAGSTATPNILFRFFVTEFEAGVDGNPSALLDEFVTEFIQGSDGAEIRSSGPIDRQGFPGTELVLHRYEDDLVVRFRQWVGRSRAYIFTATTPARDEAMTKATIDHYFDSIVLDATDAPIPAGDGSLSLTAWSTIFPPNDDFAVQMPGAPKTTPIMTTLGEDEVTGHAYVVSRNDAKVRFAVEVFEFDERPAASVIDELVTRTTARGLAIEKTRTTERQGYPARAVSFRSATESLYVVFVVTQARLYAVSLAMPVAEEQSFVEHRQRFFRSLRIL